MGKGGREKTNIDRLPLKYALTGEQPATQARAGQSPTKGATPARAILVFLNQHVLLFPTQKTYSAFKNIV